MKAIALRYILKWTFYNKANEIKEQYERCMINMKKSDTGECSVALVFPIS